MRDLLSDVGKIQADLAADHANAKPSLTIDNLSTDAPPCVKHILTAMPGKTAAINFNKLCLNVACYFRGRGYTLPGALGIVKDFIEKYSDSETHPTPSKRKENFESVWKSVQDSKGKYKFDCSYILGLGLPGSAFECKRCPLRAQAGESPQPQATRPEPQKVAVVEDTPKVKPRDPLLFPDVMSGTAGRFAHLYSEYLEPPIHFFYMAFLACLGSLLSPKLTIESEIRPPARVFMLLLGASADDRKSTAIEKTVDDFFRQAIQGFNVCHGVGSAEGLQKLLQEKQHLLLCMDEFKQFVSKCRIDGSVLLPFVTTLFESQKFEAHTKSTKISVEGAGLSLLAASTVDTYQAVWSQAFTDIGFNNRLWLVTGSGTRKFAFPKQIPPAEKFVLFNDLRDIVSFVGNGMTLGITPDADARFQQWYLGRDSSVHSKRLDGYALRFMQLLAVNDLKRVIDLEIVEKTIALCDWQLRVRKLNDPIGADNAIARLEQNIVRHLDIRGDLSDSALMRWVNARNAGLFFFQNAVSNLEKAGLIERFMSGKKRFFRLLPDPPGE